MRLLLIVLALLVLGMGGLDYARSRSIGAGTTLGVMAIPLFAILILGIIAVLFMCTRKNP